MPVDCLVAGSILLIGVALPLTLGLVAGSLGIARYDDWAYQRDLSEFSRSGHLGFTGWESMSLVGQVLWASLFTKLLGNLTWAPDISTAVLAAVGLLSAYALARRLLERGPASIATWTLVLAPGFALSTSTFMTDVPGLSLQILCLLLGLIGIERPPTERLCWLCSALAVGLFAFSIREFAIAAPLSVLLWTTLQDRRHWLRYAGVGVVFVISFGAFYLWSRHIPGRGAGVPIALSLHHGPQTVQLYFTLMFMLLPVLAWCTLLGNWDARWAALGLMVGSALAIGASVKARPGPLATWFPGNFIVQTGIPGDQVLAGVRPILFQSQIWRTLNILAVGCGVAGTALIFGLGGRMGRRPRRARGQPPLTPAQALLAIYLGLAGVGLGFYVLLGGGYFDRYLWPLVAPLGVLLMSVAVRTRPRRNRARTPRRDLKTPFAELAGLVGIVCLLGVAAALTLNADAWDGARWAAATATVRQLKVDPLSVDGGFEWDGYHSARPIVIPGPGDERWWARISTDETSCYIVSNSAPPTSDGAVLTKYRELLFWGRTQVLYTYRNPDCRGSVAH